MNDAFLCFTKTKMKYIYMWTNNNNKIVGRNRAVVKQQLQNKTKLTINKRHTNNKDTITDKLINYKLNTETN